MFGRFADLGFRVEVFRHSNSGFREQGLMGFLKVRATSTRPFYC